MNLPKIIYIAAIACSIWDFRALAENLPINLCRHAYDFATNRARRIAFGVDISNGVKWACVALAKAGSVFLWLIAAVLLVGFFRRVYAAMGSCVGGLIIDFGLRGPDLLFDELCLRTVGRSPRVILVPWAGMRASASRIHEL